MTAKISLAVAVLALFPAAVGALKMLGDDPAGRGSLMLIGAGLVFFLALLLAINAAMTVRKYVQMPLTRVHATVVEVRRTARLGNSTHDRPIPIPYELQLASGVVVELPIHANDLAQALVAGQAYRLWYLPATNPGVPHHLIYVDFG